MFQSLWRKVGRICERNISVWGAKGLARERIVHMTETNSAQSANSSSPLGGRLEKLFWESKSNQGELPIFIIHKE